MSVNDWFGNKMVWSLTDPANSLAPLMSPGTTTGTGNNRFKLKPKWKKGNIVYFTVNCKPGDLPAVWKTVTLFPRGNVPAPPPAPALPDQPTTEDITTAVGKMRIHLNSHASTTERLEGEIDVNGKRGALTFVQIPNVFPVPNAATAEVANEAFLCMFVTFDTAQQGSNPDGTAGGHSVHP